MRPMSGLINQKCCTQEFATELKNKKLERVKLLNPLDHQLSNGEPASSMKEDHCHDQVSDANQCGQPH